jgi:hypothetical protein
VRAAHGCVLKCCYQEGEMIPVERISRAKLVIP